MSGDLSSRINSREGAEDLQAWLDGDHVLDDTQDAAGGGGTPEAAIDPCWRSNMLIQVLLRGGQASPTHTFVYLDRYGGRVQIRLERKKRALKRGSHPTFFSVEKSFDYTRLP